MKERPIDGNALLKSFTTSPSGKRYPLRDCDNFYTEVHLETVQREIMNAPTLDCICVVRCKSCRHSEWSEKNKQLYCKRKWAMYRVRERDYCSYGQRKEA